MIEVRREQHTGDWTMTLQPEHWAVLQDYQREVGMPCRKVGATSTGVALRFPGSLRRIDLLEVLGMCFDGVSDVKVVDFA